MISSAARIYFPADGVLRCEGQWTINHLSALERQIAALPTAQGERLVCEAGGIQAMDTGGAWVLWRTVNKLERKGCRVSLIGLSTELFTLMQTAAKKWPGEEVTKGAVRAGWLEEIGRFISQYGPSTRSALSFLGESSATSVSLIAHPWQIRWRVLTHNLQVDGFNALPIT